MLDTPTREEIKAEVLTLKSDPFKMFLMLPVEVQALCWCELNCYLWPPHSDFPWNKPEEFDSMSPAEKSWNSGEVWNFVDNSVPDVDRERCWKARFSGRGSTHDIIGCSI